MGQFGEVSQDLHNLLIKFAEERSASISRSQGVPVSNELHSLIVQQTQRRFSVCAIKAQSACLISRLGHF